MRAISSSARPRLWAEPRRLCDCPAAAGAGCARGIEDSIEEKKPLSRNPSKSFFAPPERVMDECRMCKGVSSRCA